MNLTTAIAQLRHAYVRLRSGAVNNSLAFAEVSIQDAGKVGGSA